MAVIRVGIGGWVFKPWRGSFYPAGLPQSHELAYASQHVTSIEINGTFYGAQTPASFQKWYTETPADFVFSVKAPRFATHRRDLGEAGSTIERFLASGLLELREKLGPILWQFPPSRKFDEAAMNAFLHLLPRHIAGRRLRHAIEVHHESFATAVFVALLREHNVAVVIVDGDSYPPIHDLTADFVYARLRRSREDEPMGYPPHALDAWAEYFRACTIYEGGPRECFAYFISGAKVKAPAAAQALLARLQKSV
jgi:uncharacterized protein YecE (DUF72 family)